MKYPFTPELLDALPEELAKLYRSLEQTLLEEICSRLKIKDNLNEVTVQDIRALRSHGIPLEEIEKAIQKTTGISKKRLQELIDDVVARNQKYYTELIDFAGVTQPQTIVDETEIDAIRRQTESEFSNITRSLGFLVNSGRTKLPAADAYQWALDNAEMQVQSGAISYREAIKNAVRELAKSGIRAVEYESGHVDHADVAVRRAVMTGVSQLCAKYTEQTAEYLGTDYYEISAHIGARDVSGPSPWSSHKGWQGRVYSVKSNDKYPNIFTTCGLGYVDGLEGANCRHIRSPFIEGVSERTYTDDQLEHIDDGHDCTYEGKHYSAYEATQKQRQIERTLRKLKREEASYKAAGLKEDALDVGARRKRLSLKYTEFSRAAGLPEQRERAQVIQTTKPLVEKPRKSAIIKTGAISGALDPESERAEEHAERYYDAVRKMKTDVPRIAKNSGYPEQKIQDIKSFVFLEKHELEPGKIDRFAPSYQMAQSWQRLIEGKDIQKHDITMLQHEDMELSLMKQGYSQDEAHIMTSKVFNYAKEAQEYYDKIEEHSN